jgi:hypothetical protein
MSPRRLLKRTKPQTKKSPTPPAKKSPPKTPPKKGKKVVDDVEMAIGPTTTLKIDEEVESEEESDEEATVVPDKRNTRGVGKPKDDRLYDAERSNTETEEEVEDTTPKKRKSSPSKKRKKSTLDQTAKKWKERATRAERQLNSIANIWVVNAFQEGEVRQYAKQVLWKKVKFITCDGTMIRCMKGAAQAFEVPESEQEDWMSTYSHVVREGINAQRNHCCQELRRTLLSAYNLTQWQE